MAWAFFCVNWSEVNIKLYLSKSKTGSNKHENAEYKQNHFGMWNLI